MDALVETTTVYISKIYVYIWRRKFFVIRVLFLIRFDELLFYTECLGKYISMNGIFTLVMFEKQKSELGSRPSQTS